MESRIRKSLNARDNHMLTKHTYSLLLLSVLAVNVASANDKLVLQQKTFYDPVSDNMASHRVLVPQGWTVEGTAWWAPQAYYMVLPSCNIKLRSPDGTGIDFAPTFVARDAQFSSLAVQNVAYRMDEWQADRGIPVLYLPNSLQEWRTFYQTKELDLNDNGISDERIVAFFEIPELDQVLSSNLDPIRQQILASNRTNANLGFSQDCNTMAIGFRIEFTENNKRYEALHILGIYSLYLNTNMGSQIEWFKEFDVKFRAPKGQLAASMPQLFAVANSFSETREFASMKADLNAKLTGIVMNGMKERSRIMAEAFDDINRQSMEGWRRRNASSDGGHEMFIDAINEVQVYTQGGNSYKLPAGYHHVYGDGNGNFILTDDSRYNPNQDLEVNGSWSSLAPKG